MSEEKNKKIIDGIIGNIPNLNDAPDHIKKLNEILTRANVGKLTVEESERLNIAACFQRMVIDAPIEFLRVVHDFAHMLSGEK